MSTILSEFYRHKDYPDVIIRVLKDDAGTISVCGDKVDDTIFHLTREELDYNFEPVLEPESLIR
ncbi:hypothetical protein LCGC14_0469040 [marine sediment metagenome]|uniref:Uncharacterized protein n=1 Tax=marine sediment metagenome TaxID=412755 RepID=A0A0F9VLP4_9ZZZZ